MQRLQTVFVFTLFVALAAPTVTADETTATGYGHVEVEPGSALPPYLRDTTKSAPEQTAKPAPTASKVIASPNKVSRESRDLLRVLGAYAGSWIGYLVGIVALVVLRAWLVYSAEQRAELAQAAVIDGTVNPDLAAE